MTSHFTRNTGKEERSLRQQKTPPTTIFVRDIQINIRYLPANVLPTTVKPGNWGHPRDCEKLS